MQCGAGNAPALAHRKTIIKTGSHGGVGMADMHVAGGIINRRRNVVFLFLHWSHPPF